MAVTSDWPNYTFHVPRADLTLKQSSPTEIRECNINWLRLQIMSLEDDPEAMTFPTVFTHYPEVTLGSLTFAKVIQMRDPYTITFEDGQYAVNLTGANSNFGDRVNVNQVSVRTSNSAGLITSAEIEYASFNGGITYDEANGYAGTGKTTDGKLIGTPRAPVNNIPDAAIIATTRGFTTGYIIGDVNFDATVNLSKFIFFGQSKDITTIHVEDAAVAEECIYNNAHVTGTLDGESKLVECKITDLDYVKGTLEQCLLEPGTIKIISGGVAYLLDCWTGHTVTMADLPTIDMNGSGQSLVIRNHNGSIKIINKTGPETITASLDGGALFVDLTTVTDGFIIADGVGKIVDAATRDELSTGNYGSLFILNNTVSNYLVAETVWANATAIQLLSDVAFIKNIEGGKWKIISNQMIFYEDDNTTEVARFNLLDGTGSPTETDVRERVRV